MRREWEAQRSALATARRFKQPYPQKVMLGSGASRLGG